MTETHHALSQGAGYGIVVGVGFVFAFGMIAITAALRRYQREKIDSEEFATAGRSVKTGLISSAVVSSWTWAATLLQSTTQAYKNGVSGPFWYAAGAMVQIVLFATVAIEMKRKAPGAHTYLEVIKTRFGTCAHYIFMFFALACNILVTSMLLAGGSATIISLTGMHPVAVIFLLPLGVMIYTLFGGLKATFLTDYIHTVVMIVIIFVFVFSVYSTNDQLGSPGKVWELVTALAKTNPIEGNAQGSYLTMKSHSGGIFLVINLAGNFGTVFLDNGYWNKAIAASPAAALPGYVFGGLAWFAIPWLTATTMGLAGLALEGTPAWPTYPNRMSDADVSAGLTLPNTAVALLGKNGAAACLVMLFMAVTSAMSAELVASSSIFTYDIYKGYINKAATSKQLIWCTHLSVVIFTGAMVGLSIGFHYGGVSMGFLYLLMGVLISSAVLPACLTIFWKGMNKWSARLAPTCGMALGIMTWLVVAATLNDGVITVETAGSDYPMLAGNVVSLCSPAPIILICQLIWGNDQYDFENLRQLHSVRDIEEEMTPFEMMPETEEELNYKYGHSTHKPVDPHHHNLTATEQATLNKYSKIAKIISVFTLLIFIILWPMPMYGTGYIFSKKFFTGWVVVGIIWLFLSLTLVGLLPLWESRVGIFETARGMYWDATGRSHKVRQWLAETEEREAENQESAGGEILVGETLSDEVSEVCKAAK